MADWLQKILLPPKAPKKTSKGLVRTSQTGNLPAQPLNPIGQQPPSLPNATVIYGIGASLLFVASFSLLVQGRWFPGLIVFILGGCLTGFALHLLKHQD